VKLVEERISLLETQIEQLEHAIKEQINASSDTESG